MASGGCVFCSILAGEIPGQFVRKDDVCFVIRDIAPAAPVHLLVIPNEHFEHLENLTPESEAMLGHMASVARSVAASEGIDQSGYRLVINQRSDAGQMVDHLHMHVLGGSKLRAMA